MTDLLPCPFCGAGTTEVHPNGRMWTGQRMSDPVSVSIRHWCAEVPGQPSRMIERIGRDEESAIAAWNHRAALAAHAAPGVEQGSCAEAPAGYESTTICYTRYVSPARYANFSAEVQKWYRPYWAPTAAQPVAPPADDPADCEACDGDGKVPSPEVCSRCGYTGCWSVKCADCNGTGKALSAAQADTQGEA